ncbi:hypothetical protein EG68_11125 [Paragonimus skrjabini miyazakii]|uniref:Uncharacterized protein n=1 Tax=Paragonimus skrjabini miyazakii TaxID=59628 RepID=A0A8S9YEG2_9TREM|nr:hypothetical protein EG68_11125 [Paragonimus skrjabini miyazakii]
MTDAVSLPEIILNTATIETPAILLRSGISTSGVSILTQTSSLTSTTCLRISYQRLHNVFRPDIQFTFIAAAVFEQEFFRTLGYFLHVFVSWLGHFLDSVWRHFLTPADQDLKRTIIILISLLEPVSLGHVQLHPPFLQSDQTKQPQISPAFFSVASDMG